MSRVAIIGSGFSGLSAACFLAAAGFEVSVFEKNGTPGGRARSFETNGFTFDMGPTWYWMPDVFEKFFAHFDKKPSDFYKLARLDPSYRVMFNDNGFDLPADSRKLKELFETLEKGSSHQLEKFLEEARRKYELALKRIAYLPGLNITELVDAELLTALLRLDVIQPMSKHVRKFFKDPRLIQLLEFPVLFLGAKPDTTPALYSLMNYADMALGTWYPEGGMKSVVNGMSTLAKSLGVKFFFNSTVDRIAVGSNAVEGIHVKGALVPFDYIVASADYHHVEQDLLPASHRNYSEGKWSNKVMAPSCLIFYIGTDKRIDGLLHHTLFFDEDFSLHANEIYERPCWPTSPQFYVSCSSKSDPSVAPPGCDNLMMLIPVAAGLTDTDEIRDHYLSLIIQRIENLTRQNIRPSIIVSKSYAHRDFVQDYNAFKGNAYGLANTLSQTANLRPSIVNKKVKNMFYTGQLTVPGPGVPPAIISGEVVAKQLIKTHMEFVI